MRSSRIKKELRALDRKVSKLLNQIKHNHYQESPEDSDWKKSFNCSLVKTS